MSVYFRKNLKEAIEDNITKVNKDFLKDHLSKPTLIISYIIGNNKLIFIFNIFINSGINNNIFVNKDFINILNVEKLSGF